jgi:hypothetical protein
MPSSELAYKALYVALETRWKSVARPAGYYDDVFVETSGPTSAGSFMLITRAIGSSRIGVFASVDKRCATAPRVDPIPADDVAAFLAALPAIRLATAIGDQPHAGATYEVRVRNVHLDVTMHFADPRPPRDDLIALAAAVREVVAAMTG